jgi:hypothetical protein
MKKVKLARIRKAKPKPTKSNQLLIERAQELVEKAHPHVSRKIQSLTALEGLKKEIDDLLKDSEAPVLKDSSVAWISSYDSPKADDKSTQRNLYNALVDCRNYLDGRLKCADI